MTDTKLGGQPSTPEYKEIKFKLRDYAVRGKNDVPIGHMPIEGEYDILSFVSLARKLSKRRSKILKNCRFKDDRYFIAFYTPLLADDSTLEVAGLEMVGDALTVNLACLVNFDCEETDSVSQRLGILKLNQPFGNVSLNVHVNNNNPANQLECFAPVFNIPRLIMPCADIVHIRPSRPIAGSLSKLSHWNHKANDKP